MNREFPSVQETVYYHSVQDDTLVVVFDGQHYQNQMDGPNGKPLESFDASQFVEISRMRHRNCEFGNYPWDHWRVWAIEDGLSEDLADLGVCLRTVERGVLYEGCRHRQAVMTFVYATPTLKALSRL